MHIKIKRINQDLPLPEYKTEGAAAFDLYVREDILVPAKSWVKAPSNLVLKIPFGYSLVISARSSLAKHYPGLMIANGVGLIDCDYCGPSDEIQISLYNVTDQEISVKKGERIAQAQILKVERGNFVESDDFGSLNRGGFGTTGRG